MMNFLRSAALSVLIGSAVLGRSSFAAKAEASGESSLLLGTWQCAGSLSGSTATQTYRGPNDTTLALTTVMSAAGNGTVEERFHYDAKSGVWSLDAGKNRYFDAEHLEAPQWGEADWIFNGTQSSNGRSQPARIVYATTAPDTFVRKNQVRSRGGWQTTAEFRCIRSPLEARYDSGGVPAGDTFATVSATQSPARVALRLPGSTRKSTTNEIDRAYALTRGIWDCKTFGGADATHTYTLQGDGSIKLHNVLSIGKHAYAIDELYRFDRAKGTWTTTTSGEAYAGVAGKWLTNDWVFTGDMTLEGRRVPVTMVYSQIDDRAFRRDFTRLQNGAPATFAAETCKLR